MGANHSAQGAPVNEKQAAAAEAEQESAAVEALPAGSLQRCLRCDKLYPAEEKGPCLFHRGAYVYSPFSSAGNPVLRWSCCAATGLGDPGCCSSRLHKPCPVTSAALQQLAASLPYQCGDHRPRGPLEAECSATCSIGWTSDPRLSQVLAETVQQIYVVRPGDTLHGVALRHGVKSAQIVTWNRLVTSDLYAGQQLSASRPIPPPLPEHRPAIRRSQVFSPADPPEQKLGARELELQA